MPKVPCITLIRPWPYAITHLGKRVENRAWAPPERLIGGTLAIHAGATINYEAAIAIALHLYPGMTIEQHQAMLAAPQGIVALATLTGVTRPTDPEASRDPWYQGPLGWRLSAVRQLIEPIPMRGAQGIWYADIPADVRTRPVPDPA